MAHFNIAIVVFREHCIATSLVRIRMNLLFHVEAYELDNNLFRGGQFHF